MSQSVLNEREFELINIIGGQLISTQRDLSRHLNLSLGLTNMLIRRLIAKGYIRIRQLNKRKVEYILTPKGFSEKMRKSVKYTIKTIRSIGLIKERLREILSALIQSGHSHFFILGSSDLASLIEIVLKENHLPPCRIEYIKTIPQQKLDGPILICEEEYDHDTSNTEDCVNLIEEIARTNHLNGKDAGAFERREDEHASI